MRELGEKQSLCQLPRSISWRDSQLVYLPSLLQKAWYLSPEITYCRVYVLHLHGKRNACFNCIANVYKYLMT